MFKLYTSVSGLRKNTMQSCCGLPLRTCDVCHFPSLRTLRFCLSPFSSISSTSLSSSYSSSSSSSSSSYGDGRVSLALPIESPKGLIIKPRPRVALLSLLLVLSMAFATFLSLAILSIPTIKAFRRLASSTEQLAKVVSQEVPGTLTSLRLSGLEIHQLARQLATLRQLLSSSPLSKRHRCSKSSSSTNKE